MSGWGVANVQAPLTTAIIFLYALCGLTVLGLIVLFMLKLRHVMAEKQSRRCLERYDDYFFYLQAHGEEDERLKVPHGKMTQREKQIIQKRLFELMERVTGVHRQKLIWLCEDLGLVTLDRERLSGWWKWTKVDAAYNLGLMRSEQAVPALLQLLERSKYDPSIFIVSRAIAKSARSSKDLRDMVLALIKHRKNFHQLIVDILSDSRIDTGPLFGQFLREADADLVKIGLIGLSVHAQPSMEPALYKLAQSADKEVRIKAVKLLCRDVRYLTKESIGKFLSHQDWEIRAIMAKAIGALGLFEQIPNLKTAVGDSNWRVRRNSAHSLAQLHVDGFLALCEILQEEEAGSKTQMAHQVVQEELEKGKHRLTDMETQLQYNQKLHYYHKLSQKTLMTAHALER